MQLKDLMDLAEVNKRSAISAYKRKFGEAQVAFGDVFFPNTPSPPKYAVDGNERIRIRDFEFLKKFIEHFGDFVQSFRLNYGDETMINVTEIINLIGAHCKGLHELVVINNGSTRVDMMSKKPLRITTIFGALKDLRIRGVYLVHSGIKFDKCFPELMSLSLMKIATSNLALIEVNFPHLGELNMDMMEEMDDHGDGDQDHQLAHENVKKMFSLNPQVYRTCLRMKLDVTMLEYINMTARGLKIINFGLKINDFSGYDGLNVVFKNVITATFEDMDHGAPPISFKKLELLDITTIADPAVIDYIEKNNRLSILRLICDFTFNQAIYLVRKLPKLQEFTMNVENKEWRADDLVQFLNECKKIALVSLFINVNPRYLQSVRARVDPMWSITIDRDGQFEIKRVYERIIYLSI